MDRNSGSRTFGAVVHLSAKVVGGRFRRLERDPLFFCAVEKNKISIISNAYGRKKEESRPRLRNFICEIGCVFQ